MYTVNIDTGASTSMVVGLIPDVYQFDPVSGALYGMTFAS
jgi:hypothetical protein